MKHKFRLVMGIVFAALLILVFVFLWGKSRPKQVAYEIVTPTIDTITKTTVATGAIEPRDEVLIKPQISGIISEIYKKAGDKVVQGEAIAKIQVVPEMGALSSAENSVTVARLKLERVQQEYNRTRQLFDAKVASTEDFDAKSSEMAVAKADLSNARNNLEIIRTGVSSTSGKNSGNTVVRATISGTILDVPVKVGNSVIQANTFNDGTTIASVADMSDMIFRGKIDETEVGRIKAGTASKIMVGALQELSLDAKIEYVAPKGVAENGVIMFEIKAAVLIPDTVFIRSGYSANAEIITQKHAGVLTIPESSVKFEGDQAYVEVLTSDPSDVKNQRFKRQDVKLGISNGIITEVLSGVTAENKIKGAIKEDQDETKQDTTKTDK